MKYTSLFLFVFLLITIFVSAQTPAQTIPAFTLYKSDKTPFTNAGLAVNKMLFFFDPDCEHCQRAASYLNKQYRDFKKAAVYLVSGNSKEKMTAFINQYLPAFSSKQNVTVLQDTKDEFLTTFQPIRYPAMFLYEANKKLVDYEDNAESTFRFKKPLTATTKQIVIHMKNNCAAPFLIAISLLFTGTCLCAQGESVGIFDGHGDVGTNVKPGSATYLPQTQQYIISGAGYNVWADHDEFQYVWKKMTGDFILYTRAEFLGNWVDYHRKVGWMIRKTLDGNSPHVNAVEHGDGLTSLQFRRTAGAQTEEHKLKLTKANILQLERHGNTYIMRAAIYGQPFVIDSITDIDLGDNIYVGLFVGSHNSDVVETGVFSNVNISVPYNGVADQTTQMKLGSNLEILEVASGKRETIYHVPYSIQGPNWSTDGKSLLFNGSDGIVYNFDLASHVAKPLNTGIARSNNNDHVLSFDGSQLGLSNYVKELGGSVIYTVPAGGGTPKQVTPKGPSYLHGWSPDGKSLVFCGEREGEFDVYRVPVTGGKEERLTTTKGLDDGPEYTPDGRYIYFNSVRSGLMQIWRMKPDGSNQEQVTKDSLDNWFAHISPDGKSMVFLSFLPTEVQPGIHPPYKHVYLRMMPVEGGEPKVIAYLYGGQGSINVPSWSPDSKRVAFVSNSDMSSK